MTKYFEGNLGQNLKPTDVNWTYVDSLRMPNFTEIATSLSFIFIFILILQYQFAKQAESTCIMIF